MSSLKLLLSRSIKFCCHDNSPSKAAPVQLWTFCWMQSYFLRLQHGKFDPGRFLLGLLPTQTLLDFLCELFCRHNSNGHRAALLHHLVWAERPRFKKNIHQPSGLSHLLGKHHLLPSPSKHRLLQILLRSIFSQSLLLQSLHQKCSDGCQHFLLCLYYHLQVMMKHFYFTLCVTLTTFCIVWAW